MNKTVVMIIVLNLCVFAHCSGFEAINFDNQIINSLDSSDEYYEGIITVQDTEAEYVVQLTNDDGFNENYFALVSIDSNEMQEIYKLNKSKTFLEHTFMLPNGKYKIFYPSDIEVFYSKSEGSTDFYQERKTYNITLHAYDKNNNNIATASGSGNTEAKAREIAENSLRRSAPNAELITEKKIDNKDENMHLVDYTLTNSKIESIIVNCEMLQESKREEFIHKIRENLRSYNFIKSSYSTHWKNGNLKKFTIKTLNMKTNIIKEIEDQIKSTYNEF